MFSSCLTPSSLSSEPVSGDDLPITVWKGHRACTYPISTCVSYDHPSPSTSSFITSIDSISFPKYVKDVLSHLGWRCDMIVEMNALDINGTCDFLDLTFNKPLIASGCLL